MSSPSPTLASDTAERGVPATGGAAGAPPAGEPGGAPGRLARWRSDPARMAALHDAWRALWTSRLVVWLGGVGAVLIFGLRNRTTVFNPPGATSGFGWLGDRLAAPAARWDSAWYLTIARHGYQTSLHVVSYPWNLAILHRGATTTAGMAASSSAAFFPLYPALVGALGLVGTPLVLGGILISLGAFAVALYSVHRLTTLEILERAAAGGDAGGAAGARESARLTVLLLAFFPMAFFLSAVYSESLYLVLSVGVFWSARRGRFVIACALAGLAAATRSAGIVLLVPIVLLYLYGPRADRPPDRPAAGRLRPRYRPRADALAVVLVPLGLAAYMGYLAARGGDPMLPFHAQAVWSREFAGPVHTLWLGAVAAFDGARQLVSMQTAHKYFTAGHGSPLISAQHNISDLLFLLVAVVATVGVLRTLPLAYGAYVLAALAMPLSYPVSYEPLMSLPRFLVVLFPLFMWGGGALASRPRARIPVFAISTALLVFFVAQFATWHWVA